MSTEKILTGNVLHDAKKFLSRCLPSEKGFRYGLIRDLCAELESKNQEIDTLQKRVRDGWPSITDSGGK
jgi:hypothetical protein